MLDRPNSKAAWLARAAALKPEARAFIDGRYVAAVSGQTFARVSPIDGRVIAEIASGDAADIDRAVAAARRSFEAGHWRDADAATKKKVLLRFSELVRAHTDEIALLETLDVGKPIANAIGVDLPFCADCLQYYAEHADKHYGEIAPAAGPDELALVRQEPLGVVAMLKARHVVIGVAHENDIASRVASSPLVGPQVKHVVQVDVGQQRRYRCSI